MTAAEFIQEKAHSKSLKWFLLLMVSLTIAANYYVYDAISPLKSIMQSQLGITNSDFGVLLSFYSFPNTFLLMAIFGGIILDKWGIRKTGILFVALCVVGALLTAYGASPYYHNGGLGYGLFSSFLPQFSAEMKLLMIGRLIFGLGAETSIVVINKIIAKWFKGGQMSLAFALNIGLARVGTMAAMYLSPKVFSGESNWYYAMWIAAILMILGMLTFIIYTIYDLKFTPKDDDSAKLQADEEFHFSDIVDLLKNKSFIYISLLCVTFYSAVFPFFSYCADFLHNKFGVSVSLSGEMSDIIICGTIVFTPIFGIFVDKKGKRASLMFVGSALLFVCHLILGLTGLTPYVALFAIGIAFSLVPAAMWPSVAMIIEEKKLGTAYGVMGSIQNLGMWGFPILAGYILDVTNAGKPASTPLDYTWTMVMFAGLGIVGFLFSILLKKADTSEHGYGLELPSGK